MRVWIRSQGDGEGLKAWEGSLGKERRGGEDEEDKEEERGKKRLGRGLKEAKKGTWRRLGGSLGKYWEAWEIQREEKFGGRGSLGKA